MTTNDTATTTQTANPVTTGVYQQGGGAAGLFGSLTPMLLILLAFYFLLMRPQQKRDAKRREMIDAIKKDDKVSTTGGLVGRVHKIANEKEVVLEISEGVRVKFLKSSISNVLKQGVDLSSDVDVEEKPSKAAKNSNSKKDDKNLHPIKKAK